MDLSIDIVIPSFRLNEKHLLPVFHLVQPEAVNCRFFLVVDNPSATIPESIQQLSDEGRIHLLVNHENRGASFSRNRGLKSGCGQWVLFLDDDLKVQNNLLEVYSAAAQSFPEETGFIGLVNMPAPFNHFTRATQAGGSMDIFSVASRKPSYAWGATANIMLRRKAIGEELFSLLFPAAGGGEDLDLLFRIRENNHFKNYKTLPEASVEHPWWNDGRPDYSKSWRYGTGNSLLGVRNPLYVYYDFLNTPETILVSLPVLLTLWMAHQMRGTQVILFIGGILLIECAAAFIQTMKRTGRINLLVSGYVLLTKMIYECGLLWGNLSRLRFAGIGERFHDDGKRNKIFFYRTNTRKIVKWILYPVLIFLLLRSRHT